MSYVNTDTFRKLKAAILRAYKQKGLGSYGLMQLQISFNGPACGAAGGIVKQWPEEGIIFAEPSRETGVFIVLRVKPKRVGNRTEIEVTEEKRDG